MQIVKHATFDEFGTCVYTFSGDAVLPSNAIPVPTELQHLDARNLRLAGGVVVSQPNDPGDLAT